MAFIAWIVGSSRKYAETRGGADQVAGRPAEWAAVDASGARLLRLLGQAYLGKNDLAAARECLEHVWGLQNEKPFLSAMSSRPRSPTSASVSRSPDDRACGGLSA